MKKVVTQRILEQFLIHIGLYRVEELHSLKFHSKNEKLNRSINNQYYPVFDFCTKNVDTVMNGDQILQVMLMNYLMESL